MEDIGTSLTWLAYMRLRRGEECASLGSDKPRSVAAWHNIARLVSRPGSRGPQVPCFTQNDSFAEERLLCGACFGLQLGCGCRRFCRRLCREKNGINLFPITGRPELRVETSDAHIHVDTWDQNKIEARVSSDKWGFGQGGIQVHDHQTGNLVELEVRFPHGVHIMNFGSRRTVIEIHMPREAKVRLHTGDGEIRLRDVKGEVDIESSDGRLEVEGVEGELRAHSGDGHVRVKGRFDSLDVSTGDGPIEAEALPGSTIGRGWNLKTGDGSVSLTVPENFRGRRHLTYRGWAHHA